MSEHYFHDKDTEGNWLVSCKATGGNFSTAIWRNFKIPSQECPCCKETIRRKNK